MTWTEYNVGNKLEKVMSELQVKGNWEWVKDHTDGKYIKNTLNLFADRLEAESHKDRAAIDPHPIQGGPVIIIDNKEVSGKEFTQLLAIQMSNRSITGWETKLDNTIRVEEMKATKICNIIRKINKPTKGRSGKVSIIGFPF